MNCLKPIGTAVLACSLLTLSAYAKNEKHEKKSFHKNHAQKQKNLPRGLQMKLQRGGELPKGWQDKLSVGKVFDPQLFPYAVEVEKYKYYNKDIQKSPREKIYQIEDKIIKVMGATNIILDIFEVE